MTPFERSLFPPLLFTSKAGDAVFKVRDDLPLVGCVDLSEAAAVHF